jgi:Protein of unknown function (DUF3040)
MRLTREELLRLRDIERHLAAEEPGLNRALRGRAARREPYLVWAKGLGVVWLPIMLIGDATKQVAFAVTGIALLLTALTLGMIGLAR